MAEQLTLNQRVEGSSPSGLTSTPEGSVEHRRSFELTGLFGSVVFGLVPPLTRWTLLFAWFVLLQTAPVIAFGILVPVPLVWVGNWVRDFWTGGPSGRAR